MPKTAGLRMNPNKTNLMHTIEIDNREREKVKYYIDKRAEVVR